MFNCPICGGKHKSTSKIGQEHARKMEAASKGEDIVIQNTIAEAAGINPKTMSEWGEERDESMIDFVHDAIVKVGDKTFAVDYKTAPAPKPQSLPKLPKKKSPSKAIDSNLHEKDVMRNFPQMQRVRAGDIKDEEWQPLLKSRQMIRMNEDGGAVKRYMTPREELEFAKSIALAKGEKWSWLKERARLKALKKMDKGRVLES